MMLDLADRLDSRAAVLAAAGDHPYARLTMSGAAVTGYRTGQAVAWLGDGPFGPLPVHWVTRTTRPTCSSTWPPGTA
jgi:hypothetical protein